MSTRSRFPGAVHGLRPFGTGSAPPCLAHARCRDDAAGFTRRCGLVSCHPLDGVSSLRFDGGLSTDAGSQLPGTLASPRAGLAPAGCPQLVARLRHDHLLVVMRPSIWTHPECGTTAAPGNERHAVPTWPGTSSCTAIARSPLLPHRHWRPQSVSRSWPLLLVGHGIDWPIDEAYRLGAGSHTIRPLRLFLAPVTQ